MTPFANGVRVVPYYNDGQRFYRVDFGQPGNGFDIEDIGDDAEIEAKLCGRSSVKRIRKLAERS